MRIPEDKVEEVRNATDILSVVQGYVALKKKGQNWFGLCPFHSEDTPSFSVHQGKQIFRCFGCGKGGNVFSFLMEMERISYVEAVRMLAEKSGIELPRMQREEEGPSEAELLAQANTLARDFFYQQLIGETTPGAREAKAYLADRGYGKDVIERFMIGYAPDTWESLAEHARAAGIPSSIMIQAGLLKEGKDKHRPYDAFRHRVIFPIRNLAGRVIAFGGRRLREENESESAKYINSPETAVYRKGRELFGLWEARNDIRRQDRAVIVEGYTDCASLVMAGVGIAAASLGTSLTADQARLMRRFTPNIVIMYDGDDAGLAAARRAVDVLVGVGANPRIAVLPPDDDPDSLAQKQGGEAVWEMVNAARTPVEFQLEYEQRMGIARKASIRELLSSAALITSPVDQDVFVQEIAARTGVNLDALRRELLRQPAAPTSREPAPPTVPEKWPKPGALTALAEVMVRRPELRNSIFEMWSPSGVQDDHLLRLFTQMKQELESGLSHDPEHLLDVFPDPPLRDFISQAIFRDEEEDTGRQQDIDRQVAIDCVRKMEATGLREQIQALRERMARGAGEERTLLEEINVLIKRERQLRTAGK